MRRIINSVFIFFVSVVVFQFNFARRDDLAHFTPIRWLFEVSLRCQASVSWGNRKEILGLLIFHGLFVLLGIQ